MQLSAEKEDRDDEPRSRQAYLSPGRSGQSPRRSPGAQKHRFLSTSSSESYVKPRLASSAPGDSTRGRSPFRRALDEAKETLAGARDNGRSRVFTASAKALPAWQTHLSAQDEPAKVSIAYEDVDQAPSVNGHSSRKSGAKGRGVECSVEFKSTRSRRRAEDGDDELLRTLRDSKSSPWGDRIFDEGRAPRKAVYIEANRVVSNGKSIEVCLKLNNERQSRDSNKVSSTGETNRIAKAPPTRRAPLQQGLMTALAENRQGSKQKRGYEPPEEWGQKSTESHQHQSAGDEKCFEVASDDVEVEGEERNVAGEVKFNSSNSYGGRNRNALEDARTEETEEDSDDQRRWRRRGRVLWSTHAEPAGRGTRRASANTVRPHSQPTIRPYHGLYARSLRANGMDPTNLSCTAVHERRRHIDCSLLWRGNGGKGFAAERVRVPVDGLPDRLEAGRILDSFNRRAELLGTMSPTPLRTKAAWMENPGDPEYRYVEGWNNEDTALSRCFKYQ